MNPRKIAIQEIEEKGFYFLRHGANHDIYRSDSLNYNLTVKRHDFDEDDLRYLRKEIAKKEQSTIVKGEKK